MKFSIKEYMIDLITAAMGLGAMGWAVSNFASYPLWSFTVSEIAMNLAIFVVGVVLLFIGSRRSLKAIDRPVHQ